MDRVIIEDVLVFVSLIVGMGCVTGIVTSYFKRRGRAAIGSDVTARLDAIANRLEHLDSSIDTVAVEVERISEAQRFTARVLAERTSAAALPDKNRSGSVTPH